MKITEAKKKKQHQQNRKKESNSLIKKYTDKNFRDKYQEHFSKAFTSKRSEKAGDLSGISGKFSGVQKGSEGHLVRAFSPLPLRPQVCQPAVPDIPAQPGLNQISRCPVQSPCFSAQPVGQASPYSSRSVQRSSHLPVCGSCRPDLLPGPQNYKAKLGAEGGVECVLVSVCSV